ncbi:MAG: hypothetical protein J5858_15720 [Lentisphaeria bacterium]|nr:hypothetical protein [Lentisphaeria bacterium]
MHHLAGQYFLNTDLCGAEIRGQVGELCRAGYEAIFLHARAGMKTPYFSQEWFDALQVAIDELIRHDVKFAIWDEDNYPSGDAGNRICNSYPELASSRLNFKIVEAEAGKPVMEFFAVNGAFIGCYAVHPDGTIADLSSHCGTLRTQWRKSYLIDSAYSNYAQLSYPHRRRCMDTPRFALSWTPGCDCRIVCVEWIHSGPGRHSGDLLNPETARVLIDLIHAEYERRFPEQLKHCAASFMDEPSPAGDYPWTRRFPEEFKLDHGYDLMGFLPHLVMDVNPSSVRIRNDYRKTLHRLLCRNYLEPIRKWLNERGIDSAGHLSRSEFLAYTGLYWPNELRCFKHFDIPCCDPLGAGIGQPGAAAHHIGIKAVSSAARLFGKKAAGADAFAVGGDTVSLSDLKFMLNYHLVLGLTWFNVHGLYYTLDGERRDEAPPSLFYQHSQWPHMKTFLDYLKKRCEELTGEYVCNLAMLYPSTALQSRLPESEPLDEKLHLIAEELLSHQRDFELIDEQTLAEQDTADFAAMRPYFIVAHASWIEEKTSRFLEEYASNGGTVLVIGETPSILPEMDSAAAEKWAFAEKCQAEDFISRIPAPELTGEHAENILIRRIRKDGKIRTFLFNRGNTTFRGVYEGEEVEIAPGEAGFADELRVHEKMPLLTVPEWKLTFGPNCVPLHYWENSPYSAFDLIAKCNTGTVETPEEGRYYAVFTLENPLGKMFFVTEETTLSRGSFELNGMEPKDYQKADFRDCRELECEITPFLKPGRNKVIFRGKLMENAPYLRGRFKVQFPLGNRCGFPVLSAAPESFMLTSLRDYHTLGYGTFSGTAVYEGKTQIAKTGRYRLDLNLVKDSVRIWIDGAEIGTLIAPPYQQEIELSAGDHTIRLEVCNAPGNRDILAGVPAGLQK